MLVNPSRSLQSVLAVFATLSFAAQAGATEGIPALPHDLYVKYTIRLMPPEPVGQTVSEIFPPNAYRREGSTYEYFQSGNSWLVRELRPRGAEDVLSGEGEYLRVWLYNGSELLKIERGGVQGYRFIDGDMVLPAPPVPLLGVGTVALPLTWTHDIPKEHLMTPYVLPPEKPGTLPALVPSAIDSGDSIRETVSSYQVFQPGYIEVGQFMGAPCVLSSTAIYTRFKGKGRPPVKLDRIAFSRFQMVQGQPVAKHAHYESYKATTTKDLVSLQQDWDVASISDKPLPASTFDKDLYLKPGAAILDNGEHLAVYRKEDLPGASLAKLERRNHVYQYVKGLSWDQMLARSHPEQVPKYKPATFANIILPTAAFGVLTIVGLVVWNVRNRKARA